MTSVEPILGDVSKRVKTDLRLPRDLMRHVEAVCAAAGVPKNAFFALASALFLIRMSPALEGRKRKEVLKYIEDMFQKVISNARKAA